jgi:hypothetical protein
MGDDFANILNPAAHGEQIMFDLQQDFGIDLQIRTHEHVQGV